MFHKTVFFDLGNVILFFSHEKMCDQIALVCDLSKQEVWDILFSHHLGEKYERGTVSSQDLHTFFCKRSKKQIQFDDLMEAAGNIFTPNQPIFEIITKLKKNGHDLILLSNTCEAHFIYAQKNFPILGLFDHFVLSYEVKSVKPEPAIFTYALALAKNPKENCFYIDDTEGHIMAARTIGLDAEKFNNIPELEYHLKKRAFL